MIVWLASYPRSGNTFLRAVLRQLYGSATYTVYDDGDPVAQRVGPDLVGYQPNPGDLDTMRSSAEVFFVKTHRQRCNDDCDDAALVLVRDGRDAVVSYAHLRAESRRRTPGSPAYRHAFERELKAQITRDDGGTGNWGANVLSWLNPVSPRRIVIAYDDLIANPAETVAAAIGTLLPSLSLVEEPSIPSFAELHAIDPAFFRRGKVGSHRDELSPELIELFWSRPENTDAMAQLHAPASVRGVRLSCATSQDGLG